MRPTEIGLSERGDSGLSKLPRLFIRRISPFGQEAETGREPRSGIPAGHGDHESHGGFECALSLAFSPLLWWPGSHSRPPGKITAADYNAITTVSNVSIFRYSKVNDGCGPNDRPGIWRISGRGQIITEKCVYWC